MRFLISLTAAGVTLSGCALKGDVRRVERQVQEFRAEAARADSARAAELDSSLVAVIALLQAVDDSLTSQQNQSRRMHAETRADMIDVRRQLVQIQELTGQSQQRLTELRQQLERRDRQPIAAGPGPGDSVVVVPGLPPPDELFSLSLSQLRRGSPGAARLGFSQFLQAYASHERAPDAQYFIGESWAGSVVDSAAAAYNAVVANYPDSPRAPASLYKLGLLAEQEGDASVARVFFERVMAGYPRSEEAALARERLNR